MTARKVGGPREMKKPEYTPEYLEFEAAVLKAMDDQDTEELAILERRDPRWFEDILRGDIER